MAGSWCVVQSLALCVWFCAFCHAVPQLSNLPQNPQALVFQQTDQRFQQPAQQVSQQFQQAVQQASQQQASQRFQQAVQQQASQRFQQAVQQANQQQASQRLQPAQASQQSPQRFQQAVQASQQASQQFQQAVQQANQQQASQRLQPAQASQQSPQRFQQAVQASQQASQQFQQAVQQANQQQASQRLQPAQASQQSPQRFQQAVQASQQFQQAVQQANQQLASQRFQQAVQASQQASQQFQQPAQQASQQFSQQFQPKQPVAQAEPIDKCAVADYEQIQCGPPGISGAECDAINCCFNGQQCYYGKAVTVQCIRDGQFVVVVARDVTLPRLSLDSVRLLGGNDPPCSPVGSTPSFAIYQFPVTACGTSMMEDSGYVVYENRMTSSYEVGIGPLGSITRDSHFELLFQCRYSGTSVEALVVEVNTIPPPPPVAAPGPLRVELRLANGQCVTKGCAEGDEAYTSYYRDADYPVTKVLREPVYVEVRILERTDPNIVLILGHCWATSTPSPLSLPQWDLLVDGCPYQDDRYLTTLVPVTGSSGLQFPTHYKRFVVKMFTFVDPSSLAPLQETIFIHCSTAVCHPSSGSCEQSCARKSE
ncbi:zona pellucida sperm-binding protein 4-like isoform X1 [Chanodichthys erythropterus]|uniref:zona pellucida sperm-binding protein 4-like isoform X1 n=1 Tax=Chanodichthys erythropterus TaxID=933992 RepID=UPI00351F7445